MSALSAVLRGGEDGALLFRCPGCGMNHLVMTGTGAGPRWGWNGDVDRPTFTPSILCRWDQWVPPADTLEMADRIKRGEVVQRKECHVCHSFVTDGRIQFLGDCTHRLAGQTVDLPAMDGGGE